MKICVCLDKKNGMMFFGKRQSQDAVQRERFLSLVGNNKLWMSAYSAKLFGDLPNIVVDENYSTNAGDDDYCFVEDQPFDISKCSKVVIYKWNRQYQADKSFTVDLKAKFVTTYLTQTIKSKADEVKLIIQYFAYYLNIPVDYEQFGSLGEAYDHERGAELETLQSKYKQAQYLKDAAKERRSKYETLQKEKVKSLQEVEIILLNFKNDLLGFPNKIADDPLLSLVLNDSDEFLYAEERRLLYVAMTRTKNKTYVLVDDIIPSEFFREFTNNPGVEITHDAEQYAGEMVECPCCKTGHLVVRRNPQSNRDFLGCSHYPQCAYTVNDTSILREKRKCPACGSGFLVKRQGYNEFYGCTNYPRCSHTETFLRNTVAINSIY